MKPDDAVAKLKEVLVDFPFATEAHRSGWWPRGDSPGRAAFAGSAPFFLFDANMSRTGKGLLTDILTTIAEGDGRHATPSRKMVTNYAS